MASTLYENVEDWHSNEDRKDFLSSGEIESLQVKEDIEEHGDGYEEICPKQQPQDEVTEIELDDADGNTKENGRECSDKNGNGIDEELDEDEINDNEETVNGSERDQDDQAKDESVETTAETNGKEVTSSAPYYGKTLVAPEYMNFFPPEETSQAGEGYEAEKDSFQSTLLKEFKDQIEEDSKEEQSADEISVQTVENEKEVLEEDDLSSSEEELDEFENEVEKNQNGRQSCNVERVDQSVEEEETVEKEKQEKEEESDSSNGSKLTPLEEEGSPQLTQEDDDHEDQRESEEPEKDIKDIGIKEEDAAILNVEQTLGKGSEISPELTRANNEDSDSDEEIDIEHEESGRKHSSSLKVHVHSPTPDVSEVGSAAQSFDAGEDQVNDQQDTAQEQSFNEIGKEEQERNLFSEPIETNSNYQDEDDVEHEAVDGETYQEGDSEEDREGGEEFVTDSCHSEQGAADKVEAEVTETSIEAPLKEEYAVHFSLQGQESESDLIGRVKELGKMFDGGGPVFPSPGRNNSEGVDGSPISVRKYKAIFEQDQKLVQGARDPVYLPLGRREELINPPRGTVKNLRGLFENPQGFEARKG